MTRISVFAFLLLVSAGASSQEPAVQEPAAEEPGEADSSANAEGAAPIDPPPLTEEERQAEEARSLFRRGVDLIRQERWGEALEYFQESRAIIERPSTVMNIAACLQRLGRVVETVSALEAYLAIAPLDDPRRATAEAMMAEAEARIARLTLTLTPETATVLVDEEAIAGTGAQRSLRLDPGRHVVRVDADGHRPQRIVIVMAAGEVDATAVTLEPIPEVEPETLIVEAPRKPLTPYLVLAGSGLAGLVGATLALVSMSDYERVENPPEDSSWADIEDDFDRGVRRRRTGVILSGVGLAGLAVGIGLVLRSGDEDSTSVEATVGLGRVGLRGRF